VGGFKEAWQLGVRIMDVDPADDNPIPAIFGSFDDNA